MAIREQKRPYAPHPEVHETDYGAKFVKASTETKEEPEVVTLDRQKEALEEQLKAQDVVDETTIEAAAPVEKKDVKPSAKKKGGRPKKAAK